MSTLRSPVSLSSAHEKSSGASASLLADTSTPAIGLSGASSSHRSGFVATNSTNTSFGKRVSLSSAISPKPPGGSSSNTTARMRFLQTRGRLNRKSASRGRKSTASRKSSTQMLEASAVLVAQTFIAAFLSRLIVSSKLQAHRRRTLVIRRFFSLWARDHRAAVQRAVAAQREAERLSALREWAARKIQHFSRRVVAVSRLQRVLECFKVQSAELKRQERIAHGVRLAQALWRGFAGRKILKIKICIVRRHNQAVIARCVRRYLWKRQRENLCGDARTQLSRAASTIQRSYRAYLVRRESTASAFARRFNLPPR